MPNSCWNRRALASCDSLLSIPTGRAPRRYTDSGMRWGDSGAEATDELPADSLCAAEFGDVAADIAAVIEAVKPSLFKRLFGGK